MKSTELDKKIMELLLAYKEGLPLYNMAKMLQIKPPNLHRKLKKLIKIGLIEKIRSNITIYRICRREYPIVYYRVKCPKCETISLAEYNQLTKVCPNNDCLTKKGERTRFWIDKIRIIDKKII